MLPGAGKGVIKMKFLQTAGVIWNGHVRVLQLGMVLEEWKSTTFEFEKFCDSWIWQFTNENFTPKSKIRLKLQKGG